MTLQEKIIYLHEELGTPYSFIAEKSGISNTHLCLWLKGSKRLSEATLATVREKYEELRRKAELL